MGKGTLVFLLSLFSIIAHAEHAASRAPIHPSGRAWVQSTSLTGADVDKLTKQLGDENFDARRKAYAQLAEYLGRQDADVEIVKGIVLRLSKLAENDAEIRKSAKKLFALLIDYAKEAGALEKKVYESAANQLQGLAVGLDKFIKNNPGYEKTLAAHVSGEPSDAEWAKIRADFLRALGASNPDLTFGPKPWPIMGWQKANGGKGFASLGIQVSAKYKGIDVTINFETENDGPPFMRFTARKLNAPIKEDALSPAAKNFIEAATGRKPGNVDVPLPYVGGKVEDGVAKITQWNDMGEKPQRTITEEKLGGLLHTQSLGLDANRGDWMMTITDLDKKKPVIQALTPAEYAKKYPPKPELGPKA